MSKKIFIIQTIGDSRGTKVETEKNILEEKLEKEKFLRLQSSENDEYIKYINICNIISIQEDNDASGSKHKIVK